MHRNEAASSLHGKGQHSSTTRPSRRDTHTCPRSSASDGTGIFPRWSRRPARSSARSWPPSRGERRMSGNTRPSSSRSARAREKRRFWYGKNKLFWGLSFAVDTMVFCFYSSKLFTVHWLAFYGLFFHGVQKRVTVWQLAERLWGHSQGNLTHQ